MAALKIGIKGTGILEMNEGSEFVLHPFVRIHIIDRTTSKYLKKSDPNRPGVANKESCNFMQMKDAEGAGKEGESVKTITNVDCNYLLPMSTKMNDLRIEGVNYCNWDEEFVINESAKKIFDKNTLILFEILEFNPDLVVMESDKLNPDKLLPIAWAYLRPMGRASVHMNRLKL